MKRKDRIGDKAPYYKGGRYDDGRGYIYILVGRKKYVYEHRLVMEKKLGRKLKRTELVHHINGNRADNRIENLEMMSRSEHNRVHAKERPPRFSECHSDRLYHAHKLCRPCYNREYKKKKSKS